MAIFQYGTIITRISGSIGGTNFRLFRNMPVISNKSQGYSRNRLLSNKMISAIRWIFAQWKYLTDGDRNDWVAQASHIQFPDKFGNMRYLSGRQLYTKFNCQLLPVAVYNNSIASVSATISGMTINSLNLVLATQTASVGIINVTADNFFLFQYQVFRGIYLAPTFTRRKIIAFTRQNTNFSVNIFDELILNYPTLAVGDLVRFYVTPMALTGNRGTTSIVETDVS